VCVCVRVLSILAASGWVGLPRLHCTGRRCLAPVPLAACACDVAAGAALREFWDRSGSGVVGPGRIRDFDVVDTLGHGDYGSVFEVRWSLVVQGALG
jgi:hypothetical protein